MDYSCDQCKHRHTRKGCSRCIKTADKKPSRFKLDKKTVIVPCQAYANDHEECSLVSSIRAWNEEIKHIDVEMSLVETVDTRPLLDLLLYTDKMRYMYDGRGNCYDNQLALGVLSDAFHYISCNEIIETIKSISEREEKLILLRRRKSDIQSKINNAKQKLGI